MKVVLVMFKDGERREFPLAEARTIVGRRQDCGLRIPTKDVSRQHCEFEVGSGVALRDLGSTNGTYVNGKRIAETRLKAGDRVSIGPVVFVLQVDGQPANISMNDAAPRLEDADGAVKPVNFDDDDSATQEVLDLDDSDIADGEGAMDDFFDDLELEDESDDTKNG